MPPTIQSVYLFAFFKLSTKFEHFVIPYQNLDIFMESSDLELQDFAHFIYKLLLDNENQNNQSELWLYKAKRIFEGETISLPPFAQDNLPIPDDLNLDTPLTSFSSDISLIKTTNMIIQVYCDFK